MSLKSSSPAHYLWTGFGRFDCQWLWLIYGGVEFHCFDSSLHFPQVKNVFRVPHSTNGHRTDIPLWKDNRKVAFKDGLKIMFLWLKWKHQGGYYSHIKYCWWFFLNRFIMLNLASLSINLKSLNKIVTFDFWVIWLWHVHVSNFY